MNVKISVFCLFVSISFVLGAVSRGDFSDKNHPGKCNVEGRILDPGTHQSPTECVRTECYKSGEVEFATCGVKILPGCEPKDLVDKTVDYPDCCLQYFDCDGVLEKS